jgi:hypothetical protein
MLLPWRRFGSRCMKELSFAFFIGLIAQIGIDALLEWARNRPKEHIAEEPTGRTEIASVVVPASSKTPRKKAAPPVHPPPQDLDGSTVYTHYCDTPQGKRATFKVVVFSEAYNWQIKSVKDLEINGEKKSDDEFLRILSSEGYRQIMGDAQEIVVAGTASCEGDQWWDEESRALKRSLKLRELVERSRSWQGRDRPTRSIHTLNLGRYQADADCGRPQVCQGSRPDETWNQRKIILMAILERDADLDKEQIANCIRESVRKDEQLNFLMRHYCRYDLNTDLNGNPT